MKALTIMQPYATLIMLGAKRYETRPAPFNGDLRPEGVRGLPGLRIDAGERIAIHAGTGVTVKRRTRQVFGEYEVENDTGRRGDPQLLLRGDKLAWPYRLPLGALLGTVEVVRALPIGDLTIQGALRMGAAISYEGPPIGPVLVVGEAFSADKRSGFTDISDQFPYGDWKDGRWAIELADPVRYDKPIPMRGKQGVWEVAL